MEDESAAASAASGGAAGSGEGVIGDGGGVGKWSDEVVKLPAGDFERAADLMGGPAALEEEADVVAELGVGGVGHGNLLFCGVGVLVQH